MKKLIFINSRAIEERNGAPVSSASVEWVEGGDDDIMIKKGIGIEGDSRQYDFWLISIYRRILFVHMHHVHLEEISLHTWLVG